MTEFVSEIKTIPYGEELVYTVLSDLNNLEKVKSLIPEDKIQDFSFDADSVTFSIAPVGKLTISIVEREPNKTIKLGVQGIPVESNLWVQLKQTEEDVTKLKITARAKLNPLIKTMVSKPLQQGIDKMADVLSSLPYGDVIS